MESQKCFYQLHYTLYRYDVFLFVSCDIIMPVAQIFSRIFFIKIYSNMNVMIFLVYFFSWFFLSKSKNLIFENINYSKDFIKIIQFIINQDDTTFCYYTCMLFIFKSDSCFSHTHIYIYFFFSFIEESHSTYNKIVEIVGMQKGREYAKYTRRSAACDANVHFMHPEFLRTFGKISSNLYYVSDRHTHTRTRTRLRICTCALKKTAIKWQDFCFRKTQSMSNLWSSNQNFDVYRI